MRKNIARYARKRDLKPTSMQMVTVPALDSGIKVPIFQSLLSRLQGVRREKKKGTNKMLRRISHKNEMPPLHNREVHL